MVQPQLKQGHPEHCWKLLPRGLWDPGTRNHPQVQRAPPEQDSRPPARDTHPRRAEWPWGCTRSKCPTLRSGTLGLHLPYQHSVLPPSPPPPRAPSPAAALQRAPTQSRGPGETKPLTLHCTGHAGLDGASTSPLHRVSSRRWVKVASGRSWLGLRVGKTPSAHRGALWSSTPMQPHLRSPWGCLYEKELSLGARGDAGKAFIGISQPTSARLKKKKSLISQRAV